MKPTITPPSEDDIKTDHRLLYRGRSMKAVAAHAGASPTTYSRQRNPEETLTRNPVYEVKMEMYASKVTGQEEIGRGVFKMLFDYATELGLVDERPVDILELAIERLKGINQEDIESMKPQERFLIQGYAAELESEANRVKTDAIVVRRSEEFTPRRAVEIR